MEVVCDKSAPGINILRARFLLPVILDSSWSLFSAEISKLNLIEFRTTVYRQIDRVEVVIRT